MGVSCKEEVAIDRDAMLVSIMDKLFEICGFCFAAQVVEGALFHAAICWVFGIKWRAIIDVECGSGEWWKV